MFSTKRMLSLVIILMMALGVVSPGMAAEPAPDGTVDIYLIRHGQTMFNLTGQIQGWADTPLLDSGVEQAVQAGAGLADVAFATAYSSDLGRARHTALLILGENGSDAVPTLTELTGLREQGYGGYEGRFNADLWGPLMEQYGLTYDDERTQWPEFTALLSEAERIDLIAASDPIEMAETYDEIATRSTEAIEQIVQETLEKGGGNALAVSHGGEILTILSLFVPEFEGQRLANCSLSILRYQDGDYTLELVGDTSYME